MTSANYWWHFRGDALLAPLNVGREVSGCMVWTHFNHRKETKTINEYISGQFRSIRKYAVAVRLWSFRELENTNEHFNDLSLPWPTAQFSFVALNSLPKNTLRECCVCLSQWTTTTGDQNEIGKRTISPAKNWRRGSSDNTQGPGGTIAADAQGYAGGGDSAAAGATEVNGADLYRHPAHCFTCIGCWVCRKLHSLSPWLPEFTYDPDNGLTFDV